MSDIFPDYYDNIPYISLEDLELIYFRDLNYYCE